MNIINGKHTLLLFGLLLLAGGCSKSDDQKDFEEHAYTAPSGFTEYGADPRQGPVSEDPDDWRISPLYQGLIGVATPAYPNPVVVNSTVQIDIDFKVTDAVQAMEVYVFKATSPDWVPIRLYDQSELPVGVKTITLNPAEFYGGGSQEALGLHRLLFFDGRENLITYGDIMVE